VTEKEHAVILANKVLDRVNADPDDDLAVLARQLLRTREALESRFDQKPSSHPALCYELSLLIWEALQDMHGARVRLIDVGRDVKDIIDDHRDELAFRLAKKFDRLRQLDVAAAV
jgi:hypothetical protein